MSKKPWLFAGLAAIVLLNSKASGQSFPSSPNGVFEPAGAIWAEDLVNWALPILREQCRACFAAAKPGNVGTLEFGATDGGILGGIDGALVGAAASPRNPLAGGGTMRASASGMSKARWSGDSTPLPISWSCPS